MRPNQNHGKLLFQVNPNTNMETENLNITKNILTRKSVLVDASKPSEAESYLSLDCVQFKTKTKILTNV